MFKEKEAHLRQYYLLTESMMKALVHNKENELLSILEEREECIFAIDRLDEASRKPIMNDRIQQQVQAQLALEQHIKKEMQKKMVKLSQQVRSVQNEKFLSKQYEDAISVSKGVFYDIKK